MCSQSKPTVSFHLVAGTILTAFGSSMLFGYNVAIFNLPDQHVKTFLTSRMDKPQETTETALYSVATSIFLVGGAFGAFSSGVVADWLGRRNGLIANDLVMVLGSALFFVSFGTSVPELVYVARAITGISSGMTLGLASMYLTEIAPVQLRGFIGSCHQLATAVGTMLSNVATFSQLLGREGFWMIAAGLACIPALTEAILHGFLPESPRYLLLKGRVEEAKAAHEHYNPSRNVEDFVDEMRHEAARQADSEFRYWHIFTRKYSRAMWIACLCQVMAQLSGINAVRSYSKTMMARAGVQSDVIQYCVFGVSTFGALCTGLSLPLMERCGRRCLLLWSTPMIALSLVGLGISVQLQANFHSGTTEEHLTSGSRVASIVAIVFIFMYTASFAVGVGSIQVLIVSEIFRQGPRGAAYSVSQVVRWICTLTAVLVYPNVEKQLNGIVFFILLVFVIPVWLLFFFIMPETKGRTVNEVCGSLETPIAFPSLFKRRSAKKNKEKVIEVQMDELNGDGDEDSNSPTRKQSVVTEVEDVV